MGAPSPTPTAPTCRLAWLLALATVACEPVPTLVVTPPAETHAARPIQIDGLFDDWADVPWSRVDATGDAGHAGIDLRALRLANDGRFLFVQLELVDELILNEGHSLTLLLDTDADPDTGQPIGGIGAELMWTLGEREGELHLADGSWLVYQGDLRFRALPTVSSPRFELALGLAETPGGQPLIPGPLVDVVLYDRTAADDGLIDGDRLPDEGAARYRLDPGAVPPVEPLPLDRVDDGSVRLLSWNTLWDGITDPWREDAFRRVLQAADPDIITLQEVTEAEGVHERVDAWLPLDGGASWHRKTWGSATTLSRWPFAADWPPSYEPIDDRIVVAAAQLADGSLLVVFNAHLSCCDAEGARQQQADSFVAYVREIMDPASELALPPGTPMLMAGDLNLVMGSQPLRTLRDGEIVDQGRYGPPHPPDWDGTSLRDVRPRQAEKRMAYTWRSDGSSYWPGRLDYVLLTDSSLEVNRDFIIYTHEMSSETLVMYGLNEDDSSRASDHLPLVVDLTPIPGAGR